MRCANIDHPRCLIDIVFSINYIWVRLSREYRFREQPGR